MTTALMIIDVQVSLVADETPNPDEVLAAVNTLVANAREAGAPVVWVTDTGVEPDPALHPALLPEAGELRIVKSVRSAFEETDLDAQLKARGVERVVICGMQSDACIDGTTRAAAYLGYQVMLAADAHTTYAFEGRDWRAIIASQNADLGRIEHVTALSVSEISFAP